MTLPFTSMPANGVHFDFENGIAVGIVAARVVVIDTVARYHMAGGAPLGYINE